MAVDTSSAPSEIRAALCAQVGNDPSAAFSAQEAEAVLADLETVVSFELIAEQSGNIYVRIDTPSLWLCQGGSLFAGNPPHDNFFYLIVRQCQRKIPAWFFNRHIDTGEDARWAPFVDDVAKIG